jgi:hypothetical protein
MSRNEALSRKLDHVRVHFELFKAELTRYFESNPGAVVRDAESPDDRPTFSWQVDKPVPAFLAFTFGDCIQNLRSCLDYLVWELVLAAHHHPDKKHMFPICEKARAFQDAIKAGRLRDVMPDAVAVIEDLQPYQAAQPNMLPLAVLDELVNINKHRRVLLTYVRSVPRSYMFTVTVGQGEEWGIPAPFLMDSNAQDIGQRMTVEEMNAYGSLAAFVAIGEGPAKGMEITITLDSLISFVADEIISKFNRFF